MLLLPRGEAWPWPAFTWEGLLQRDEWRRAETALSLALNETTMASECPWRVQATWMDDDGKGLAADVIEAHQHATRGRKRVPWTTDRRLRDALMHLYELTRQPAGGGDRP